MAAMAVTVMAGPVVAVRTGLLLLFDPVLSCLPTKLSGATPTPVTPILPPKSLWGADLPPPRPFRPSQ